MLNNEDLSMLVIKQGMYFFTWYSTTISKEGVTICFNDNDANVSRVIPVESLTKEHFLEGVKNYFGSTPFSTYLELPLDCECDGCIDGEDEEAEIPMPELLELLHIIFDRRNGE